MTHSTQIRKTLNGIMRRVIYIGFPVALLFLPMVTPMHFGGDFRFVFVAARLFWWPGVLLSSMDIPMLVLLAIILILQAGWLFAVFSVGQAAGWIIRLGWRAVCSALRGPKLRPDGD